MMGFTGVVFQRFFGSSTGQLVSLGALLAGLVLQLLAGQRAFLRKNF